MTHFLAIFLLLISFSYPTLAKTFTSDFSSMPKEIPIEELEEECSESFNLNTKENIAKQIIEAKIKGIARITKIEETSGSQSENGIDLKYLKRSYIVVTDISPLYPQGVYQAVQVVQFYQNLIENVVKIEVKQTLLNYTDSAELAERFSCGLMTYK